jgi:hypothetical protein
LIWRRRGLSNGVIDAAYAQLRLLRLFAAAIPKGIAKVWP